MVSPHDHRGVYCTAFCCGCFSKVPVPKLCFAAGHFAFRSVHSAFYFKCGDGPWVSPIAGNTALDTSFLGGAYGLYIVFGYFVMSGGFDARGKSRIVSAIGAVSYFLIVAMLFISSVY